MTYFHRFSRTIHGVLELFCSIQATDLQERESSTRVVGREARLGFCLLIAFTPFAIFSFILSSYFCFLVPFNILIPCYILISAFSLRSRFVSHFLIFAFSSRLKFFSFLISAFSISIFFVHYPINSFLLLFTAFSLYILLQCFQSYILHHIS